MPGGKRATVYAFKDELDAWASSQARMPADEGEMPPVSVAPRRKDWIKPALIAILCAVITVGAYATLSPKQENIATRIRLPDTADATRLFLQARDDAAKRQPESLSRAITALIEVTRKDPEFVPAHTSLAEAYLLAREFGTLRDGEAFAKAKAAAERAMALDPSAAEAHRALGFIAYWRDHDAPSASKAFLRANALSPNNAQTHFWYGNVLSDNGAHQAALRELNAARLIEPGSVAIQTDLAWALWSAGKDQEAKQMLQRLLASDPKFAVIHDCLSAIHLAEGDYTASIRAFGNFARLRGDLSLQQQAKALEAKLPDGTRAVQAMMMDQARADIRDNPSRDHVWVSFLASLEGDRAALRGFLETAERRQEQWGSSGLMSRIATRWQGDAEISRLLAQRRAKPIA